jgi:hypothetical protein
MMGGENFFVWKKSLTGWTGEPGYPDLVNVVLVAVAVEQS